MPQAVRPVGPPASLCARFLRRLAADTRGNVLMIAGGAMFIMTFVLGFGIDYSRSQKIKTKLDAAADAAALVAVDPALIGRTDAEAVDAASKMFDAQVAGLSGVSLTRNITAPTANSGALAGTRTATISYTATVTNYFGAILGQPTLVVGGRAAANASVPPSIKFFVVLDTSPSMLLPTTSDGITKMKNGTLSYNNPSGADGCAFACHTQNIQSVLTINDNASRKVVLAGSTIYRLNTGTKKVYNAAGAEIGNTGTLTMSGNSGTLKYKATGFSTYTNVSVKYPDSWWLARNYGSVNPGEQPIQLRVDAETMAARGVITYAKNAENLYASAPVPPKYFIQFFTFDYGAPSSITAMADVATMSDATVPDIGANVDLLYDYYYWTSSSIYTGDKTTDFTTMFTSMNTTMPAPGTGTSPTDPQEVMILVTDGMADQTISGGSCQGVSNRGCQQLTSAHITQCGTIKNRNIRIAVLYTEYLASSIQNSGLSFADAIAINNIPQIEPQLQACASTNPDGSKLYQKVAFGGDVTAALNTLFAMSLKTARLTQ